MGRDHAGSPSLVEEGRPVEMLMQPLPAKQCVAGINQVESSSSENLHRGHRTVCGG